MKFIFGPVASRRLGRSLGVDLIPYKTCSFDCIYCELGRTTHRTIDREEYIPHKEVIHSLKQYLKETTHPPDHITLGGSGEPTLHSQLGHIVSEIKNLSSIPVAVLTNASLLYQDEVKKELLKADVILPSLDAASPSVFKYVNRPHPSLAIKAIIQGLKDFRKAFSGQIWLEILFCLGVNDTREEINRLNAAVQEIDPDKIQLNSIDRPPAEEFTFPVTREQLEHIKQRFGEKAEIITGSINDDIEGVMVNGKRRVLDLLKRRPGTVDDISRALGIHKKELTSILELLIKEGKIYYRIHNNQCYYQVH